VTAFNPNSLYDLDLAPTGHHRFGGIEAWRGAPLIASLAMLVIEDDGRRLVSRV